MSGARVPGSLRISAIRTRWVSMIARALPVRGILLRAWRRTVVRRGVSCPSRPVVLLTLIGLVASVGFSASLVPLAAPASATTPAVTGGVPVAPIAASGRLVSAGDGTAFAVILAAHRAGRLAQLWVDETRPLLQGSRLTAYEARRAGIPHAVLADGAAASLMAAGQVDLVLTGADRIAADGSVANKVGTYGLAVLARHHQVPFVVVAPESTVDAGTPDGAAIPVEQRPAQEVVTLAGQLVAPAGTAAYNPAFDVTPGKLITAIILESGVCRAPYQKSLRLAASGKAKGKRPL